MLKYFYIILFSITVFSQNNFDYSFTNPLIVSNDSELGLNRPRIVVDQVGNPVIIWTSFSENKLFISRKIENTFSEPQLITPEGFTFFSSPNYGPEIYSHENNILISLYNVIDGLYNLYVIYSQDGGITFSNPIKIIEENSYIEGAGIHITENNIPVLTYEKLTNSGEASHLISFGQFIEESPGFIFSDFIIVNESTEGVPCECCLGDIASSNQDLVFTYRNNIDNVRNMYACYYDNENQIFNEGFSIDNYDQSLTVCPTEGPKSLIHNDLLFSTFKSYAYSPARIGLTVTDYSNEIVQNDFVVDWQQGFGTQSLPEISKNNSHVAIVWKEFRYYNIDAFISVFDASTQNNFSITPSFSVSSSEPNSTTAEDYTAVDIIGFDDEFHLTYLDYNNKILYYRKLSPQNNTHLENFKLNRYKLKTIDILGRDQFKSGLSIDIYNDGSTEKKYRLK